MRVEDQPDFSEICFVGGELTEFNAKRFGSEIRRVDISFNKVSKLGGLETCANNLEEVILDNNQLEIVELITEFPKLETLSMNKNKISNLKILLENLKSKAPNLRYLSLLGNPICPDQLSDDFVDDSDYQIYRYHVLFHLRTLKFLDHRQVSLKEMTESRKPLYGNLQIYPTVTPLPQSLKVTKYRSSSTSNASLSGSGSSAPTRSRQGKRKYKYMGKNSEGNRFIKDMDL